MGIVFVCTSVVETLHFYEYFMPLPFIIGFRRSLCPVHPCDVIKADETGLILIGHFSIFRRLKVFRILVFFTNDVQGNKLTSFAFSDGIHVTLFCTNPAKFFARPSPQAALVKTVFPTHRSPSVI
jgi:hypothetical protein